MLPASSSIAITTRQLSWLLLVGLSIVLQSCSGGNSVDYTMATEAQERMEADKAAAQEAKAADGAPELYDSARRYEERGDLEFAQGDYSAARTNYIEAGGFYRQAATIALASDTTATVDPAQTAAEAARAALGPLQNEAQRAGAATVAPDWLNRATQSIEAGDEAFAAGSYAAAQRAFQRAAEELRTARDQANQARLADEADPVAIRNEVMALAEDVTAARQAAARAQSTIWAESQWEQAQNEEETANRYFQQGTRAGYLRAQASYSRALDAYRAAQESAVAAAAADQAEKDQRAREEATARARAAAGSARSAMEAAKGQVTGTAAEKNSDASYQAAVTKERNAETAFRNDDYAAATRQFTEAAGLYERAATQIAAARREAESTPPPPTPPPAPDETAERRRAEEAIDRLIGQFERGLETSNLEALVPFREDRANWEEFFKNVKDIAVATTLDRRDISLANGTARVSLRATLSYTIKSEKERRRNNLTRRWDLERINGNWVVVGVSMN